MKIDLQKNNILVTGASRGIGAAVHYNNDKESAEAVAEGIRNESKIFKANLEDPVQCEMLFK